MADTDASASLKGYLYQNLVALYLCVKFLVENEEGLENRYLVFEKFDDLALVKGVYNTKTETWDQKQELHLFQTKYVKNDSLSTHRKAILQIYLNIERWKDEGWDNTSSDFITKRNITHSRVEQNITTIVEYLSTTKVNFRIPQSTDTLNNKGKLPRGDFPRISYENMSFPNSFTSSHFNLSPYSKYGSNKFSDIPFFYIKTYISDHFYQINSNFGNPSNLIDRLYFIFTKVIFENEGSVSLVEISRILTQTLDSSLDDLISSCSSDWKENFIKETLMSYLEEYFDAKSIVDLLFYEEDLLSERKHEIIELLNYAFDELMKGISENDYNSRYTQKLIKDISMNDNPIKIESISDFVDIGSIYFSKESIERWLRLYLSCYIRCNSKSFEEKIIIIGANYNSVFSSRSEILKMDFEADSKIIGCEDRPYGGSILDSGLLEENQSGDELVDNKFSQIVGDQLNVCCMRGIKSSYLYKFRDVDDECVNPDCGAKY